MAGYLERDPGIQSNWTEKGRFVIYFCVFFECYCGSLIPGRDTGRWDMSPSKFGIFLIFLYFPKSQVLSSSETCQGNRIPSLLY